MFYYVEGADRRLPPGPGQALQHGQLPARARAQGVEKLLTVTILIAILIILVIIIHILIIVMLV